MPRKILRVERTSDVIVTGEIAAGLPQWTKGLKLLIESRRGLSNFCIAKAKGGLSPLRATT
jgi:hypothetical protein